MNKNFLSAMLLLAFSNTADAASSRASLADYFSIGQDKTIIRTDSSTQKKAVTRFGSRAFQYVRPGSVSMALNPSETTLTIIWNTGVATDQLGCSFDFSGLPYFEIFFDQRKVDGGFLTGRLITGPGGVCTLTYELKASNGGKLPAGNYSAYFQITASGATRTSSGSRAVAACTPARGKRPIHLGYHDALTDNFYTLSYNEMQLATTIGYNYLGSPFAMPHPEALDTVPFDRYYKGAPQYEHFYSTDGSEYRFLTDNGYEFEGIEGDVYSIAKPGTQPLYRYTRFNPSNSDLYHYYTVNLNDPYTYGMQYEGVVGHVCPSN